MKSTVESIEPTRAKVTIEVDYEELKPQMDAAYREIAHQVNIPGFRKGHVPARIIDQRFGRGLVIEQVINEVVPEFYGQAITENQLRPMAQPAIDVVEIPAVEGEPGGILKFVAEVDYVPDFELPNLENLEVTVPLVPVDEAAVNAELDDLRGRFATLINLDRPAEDGDFLTLDLVAMVEDAEIDSLSEVSYELGSGSMMEGQDEALRGKSAGDEVSFTSEVRGGEHVGKEATITIKVNSVKERELPEADDDFAQMVSEFDTVQELLEDLEGQVADRGRSMQALGARDTLLNQLVEQTEILLPAAAVEHEVGHQVTEDASDEEREAMRERVERTLREQIFLETLAEKQDVMVGNEELLEFMFHTAQTFGTDINELLQDQNQIQGMAMELARTKALVSVLREATVKDSEGNVVDISEFTADRAAATEEGEETAEIEVEDEASEVDGEED